MPTNRTRGDYDQLAQIATRFGREAQTAEQTLRSVREQMNMLEGGDWLGQGARAFYAEMNSAVLPSLTRLVRALQSAQRVTAQISREIKVAEDEAAAILKDKGAKPALKAGFSLSGFIQDYYDQAVAGFFEGMWEGAKGMVEGLWTAVRHPIQTAKGLAYGVTHPSELWDALKKPYVDDWQSGNYGRAIGRGVFEVGMLLIPGIGEGKGVAKGAEVGATAARLAEMSDAARVLAKGGQFNEAARVLRVGEVFSDSGEMARIVARSSELEPVVKTLAEGEQALLANWDTLSEVQKFETAEAFNAARRGLESPDAAKVVQRFGAVNPSDFPKIMEKFGGDIGTSPIPPEVVGKPVIALGSRDATLAAAKQGERILNAAEGWSEEMNALWAHDAATNGEIIHLRSPVQDAVGSMRSVEAEYSLTTVYARELDVFLQHGYTRVGDYLIPPTSAGSSVGKAVSGGAAIGIVNDRLNDNRQD